MGICQNAPQAQNPKTYTPRISGIPRLPLIFLERQHQVVRNAWSTSLDTPVKFMRSWLFLHKGEPSVTLQILVTWELWHIDYPTNKLARDLGCWIDLRNISFVKFFFCCMVDKISWNLQKLNSCGLRFETWNPDLILYPLFRFTPHANYVWPKETRSNLEVDPTTKPFTQHCVE